MARTIGMMAPDTSVKLDVLRNGAVSSVTVTLGQMPNEKHAKAESENAKSASDVPYLGLMLAPADEMAGSGSKGVVVTGVDPNRPKGGVTKNVR